MKLYILILLSIFFVSCATKPPIDNAVNENVKEKNKETAVKNEVTKITRFAQAIEQQGRDLQSYREAFDAESSRQCNQIVEETRKQTADLEIRMNNLSENYKKRLLPIVGELNECVSCAKKSLDDCKKARASINQAIKELYP
ncbi:MAG: hypothetical protein M3Q78_03715 [Acidobacteriota bacterium]|nr:hypothetical protein [Acidobacteriota bacterium]